MTIEETLAVDARVTVELARAMCEEVGVSPSVDLDTITRDEDVSLEVLTHIQKKMAIARSKLKKTARR